MSYHGYDDYIRDWKQKEKKTDSDRRDGNPPSVQIISPQKKLYDIQQIIHSLPDKHMTTYELQDAIQKILDGEV
jgi:hypothetical protein